MTYNGLNVSKRINTNRIISAFENDINWNKIDKYTAEMQEKMLSHDFPAILGFPSVICEDDLGKCFLTNEEITEEHIGIFVWNVTDGHHRSISAINANIPYLEVELDYSCITVEEELKQF